VVFNITSLLELLNIFSAPYNRFMMVTIDDVNSASKHV